jgi:hypothetical protein
MHSRVVEWSGAYHFDHSTQFYVELVQEDLAWRNASRTPKTLHRSHNPNTIEIRNATTTMSLINQQQSVSLETNSTPSEMPASLPLSPKASDFLFGSKGFMGRATPQSLTKMMNSNSLTVRSAFLQDCERRRKASAVRFAKEESEKTTETGEVDYGYGEDLAPPPTKKRRMERRNSKTPRMLMAMSASLATLDFLNDDKDESLFKTTNSEEGEDAFDGGLKIAEELVMHLQNRRRGGLRL